MHVLGRWRSPPWELDIHEVFSHLEAARIVLPGDSIRDLFRMVKRDPQKSLSDLQRSTRGSKGHGLNHLRFWIFLESSTFQFLSLDPSRGAKWMGKGSIKQPLRVLTPPIVGCWSVQASYTNSHLLFSPLPGGRFPIWRAYFFRWVGKKHQLILMVIDVFFVVFVMQIHVSQNEFSSQAL